jgi:glutamyl-tRNA synthetase
MLALLGWNPGTDQELFSLNELIEAFSLERVGKSGSQFDPEKAKWFNHQYMQSKDNREIATLFAKELKEKGIDTEIGRVEEIIKMVKERATFVTDLWNQADFFFIAPESYDKAVVAKRWDPGSASLMGDLKEVLSSIKDFTSENSESIVKSWIAEKGLGMGVVMNLFRLLIVGESRGPHLFDIIAWLGKEETIRRVERGINRLS